MKSALKKSAAAAAMCLAAIGAVHAATYSAATTGPYTAKTDFTVCSGGPCQNYTLAMTPSGSFTTSAPLAANLSNANIAAQITSFSFNDGINTFASTDPNVRIFQAIVSTSATGSITSSALLLELWQTGTSPHAVGDKVALIQIGNSVFATNTLNCTGVGTTPAGAADSCVLGPGDIGASNASGAAWTWAAVTPPATAATPVPSTSALGLLVLSALLGGAGLAISRRNRNA
ncbi:IPTL-CTERM sorting domain-containing protein [Delftia sp. ASV31]|uniref:IPTL-CTERM sorting domain-containing protein n=1 Tax=Delftia sp. ASV31 TaxID=2795113 RepID=UPI0035ABBA0B